MAPCDHWQRARLGGTTFWGHTGLGLSSSSTTYQLGDLWKVLFISQGLSSARKREPRRCCEFTTAESGGCGCCCHRHPGAHSSPPNLIKTAAKVSAADTSVPLATCSVFQNLPHTLIYCQTGCVPARTQLHQGREHCLSVRRLHLVKRRAAAGTSEGPAPLPEASRHLLTSSPTLFSISLNMGTSMRTRRETRAPQGESATIPIGLLSPAEPLGPLSPHLAGSRKG